MKSATILTFAVLAAFITANVVVSDPDPEPYVPPKPLPGQTCILRQECLDRPEDKNMSDSTCPSTSKINNPQIVYFEPKPLYRPDNLKLVCPYIDGTQPVCCNDDQVELMGKYKQNWHLIKL